MRITKAVLGTPLRHEQTTDAQQQRESRDDQIPIVPFDRRQMLDRMHHDDPEQQRGNGGQHWRRHEHQQHVEFDAGPQQDQQNAAGQRGIARPTRVVRSSPILSG